MRHVAAVMLEDEFGRMLLQLRDNKPTIICPNMWSFFGGGIEMDEMPFDAAIREIKEELCISLSPDRLSPFTIYGESSEKWLHVFHYSIDSAELTDIKLMEGQQFGLWTQTQIETGVLDQHDVSPHAKDVFAKFFAN